MRLKNELDAQVEKPIAKGTKRNFLMLFGLTTITFGIYCGYWLYVNIKEIKEVFLFEEDKRLADNTKNMLFMAMTIIFIMISGSVYYQFQNSWKDLAPSFFKLYLALSFIYPVIIAVFFYAFTKTVALAQTKVSLVSFSISKVNMIITAGIVLHYIGFISILIDKYIPVFTIIELVLFLVYLYIIQKQINRIWAEEE